MRINQFAKAFNTNKRSIDYYTIIGLLHPEVKATGLRDYGPNCEKEMMKILIVEAMGVRPYGEYIAMLDHLPKAEWDNVVLAKIRENIERYQRILGYAEALKKGS